MCFNRSSSSSRMRRSSKRSSSILGCGRRKPDLRPKQRRSLYWIIQFLRFYPLIPYTHTGITRWISMGAGNGYHLGRGVGLPTGEVNITFSCHARAEVLSWVSTIPPEKFVVTLFLGRRESTPISCGFFLTRYFLFCYIRLIQKRVLISIYARQFQKSQK